MRAMGPSGRLAMALEMSDTARELVCDGIRLRHPEYDEVEVRLTAVRLTLGDALYRDAYPAGPHLPA